MNTIETPITKEKVAALVADAFQDSEYFLPKIALQDQLGLDVEVISLKRDPIEIYSNFSRIGLLDVGRTIQEADPRKITHCRIRWHRFRHLYQLHFAAFLTLVINSFF